jgi:uncharacterized protein YndB with AHSA1/START domain
MATIRHHARIARSPDEVWQVVADAGSISTWFPLIEESRAEGGSRYCSMKGGGKLEEEIVTSDDELRRFQYRITGGDIPVEHHIGTVDVLEDGSGSLVIYSTDVTPDAVAETMNGALAEGLQGLKAHLEA